MFKAKNSLRNQRRIYDPDLRRQVPKSTYYERLRKKRRATSETNEVSSGSTSSRSTSSSNRTIAPGNSLSELNFNNNVPETPPDNGDVHLDVEMHDSNDIDDNSSSSGASSSNSTTVNGSNISNLNHIQNNNDHEFETPSDVEDVHLNVEMHGSSNSDGFSSSSTSNTSTICDNNSNIGINNNLSENENDDDSDTENSIENSGNINNDLLKTFIFNEDKGFTLPKSIGDNSDSFVQEYMEFIFALRTWQLDSSVSNSALTSLLNILRTTKNKKIYKHIPKTSSLLIRQVNKQYRTAPDLCVDCNNNGCTNITTINGMYLTEVLGKGWFGLSRGEICNLIAKKKFIDTIKRTNKTLCCEVCCKEIDLDLIKNSSIFWFYSPLKWFIKDLFNDPCSLSLLLSPYDTVLPSALVDNLNIIRGMQVRSREELNNVLPELAEEVRNSLLFYENNPEECMKLFYLAKRENAGYDKSQPWHGFRYYCNEDNLRICIIWNVVLSVLFDWFAPFKTGVKSLGPLVASMLSMPREAVAKRTDLYMYILGYFPCDKEENGIKLQRYLTVFKRDFLEIRSGYKIYNALMDHDTPFYISFGTLRGDSPADCQVMCSQASSRAYFTCFQCRGLAIACPCTRKLHADWSAASANKHIRKTKMEFVEWGKEIDAYTYGLFMKELTGNIEYRTYTKKGLGELHSSYGLVGYCVLNDIPEFDPSYDVINEGLHLFFLNLAKTPPVLWLKCKQEDKSKYFKQNLVNNYKSILERRLQHIVFPRNITRKALCVIDKPSRLIGEEWKNFILLIALPLFRGILNPAIFNHYKVLSKIITLCLYDFMDSSTLADLQTLIDTFDELHLAAYGKCNFKRTTHRLLHVPQDIESWSIPKCQWTCGLEGIPKSERKLVTFTNGRNVNHAFSRICAEKIAQKERFCKTSEKTYSSLKDIRNKLQSKEYQYYQSIDNRCIYLGVKCKVYSPNLLKEYLLSIYDNNFFILDDFVKLLYTTILRYTEEELGQLDDDSYNICMRFLEDFFNTIQGNDIWNPWVNILEKHNISITSINQYKSVFLNYRKFYGISNHKHNPLYGQHKDYSSQGEWVETNININNHTCYGRIHSFFYININFAGVLEKDYLVVFFYDWVKGNTAVIDTATDYVISSPVNMELQEEGYFQSICCINNKICLQPLFKDNEDTVPHNVKRLIIPYHTWY